MIAGLITFIVFFLFGEWVRAWLDWPVPGAIIGMILLLLWQIINRSSPRQLSIAAAQLLPLLPLFIIPASVGVIFHLDLLRQYGWQIAIAMLFSLIIGFIAVIYSMTWFEKKLGKKVSYPEDKGDR